MSLYCGSKITLKFINGLSIKYNFIAGVYGSTHERFMVFVIFQYSEIALVIHTRSLSG
jgi:hypothetical protein